MPEITLYGTKLSGHTHRVELLLRMLELPYRNESRPPLARHAPEFRAMNPLGQIPVLRDGDLVLADSNAILVYLAKRYDQSGTWLPDGAIEAASVQRFLSIAAGEVAYGPALARSLANWGVPEGADPARARAISTRAFAFIDQHMRDRAFLAAAHPTVADLACYSYIAMAEEGGVALAPYPALLAWLRRVEALAQFEPMPPFRVPERADA